MSNDPFLQPQQLRNMNIPELVANSKGSKHGISIIGVLKGEVHPPKHMRNVLYDSSDSRFAVMDILGYVSPTMTCYARGQVLVNVNRAFLNAAKKKTSGRLAVVLSTGTLRLNENPNQNLYDFISYLKWSKSSYNTWQVRPVETRALAKKEFPQFFDLVAKAYQNNWVYDYPTKFDDNYNDCCGDFVFEMVDQNNLNAGFPPRTTQPNPNSVTANFPYNNQVNQSTNDNQQNQPNNTQPQNFPYTNQTQQQADSQNPHTQQNYLQQYQEQTQQANIPALDTNLFTKPLSLGVSNQSNVEQLIQNRSATNDSIKDTSRFKVENRDEMLPESPTFRLLTKELKKSKDKVKAAVTYLKKLNRGTEDEASEELKEIIDSEEVADSATSLESTENTEIANPEEDEEGSFADEIAVTTSDTTEPTAIKSEMLNHITFTAQQLKQYWYSPLHEGTGSALFKEAVLRVLSEDSEARLDQEFMIYQESILNFWYDISIPLGGNLDGSMSTEKKANEDDKTIRELIQYSREAILMALYEILLDLTPESLIWANRACSNSDISIFAVLENNPYDIAFLTPSIGVTDLDKLAMMYKVSLKDEEILKSRNAAYMHNYLLDSTNKVVRDNTAIKRKVLIKNAISGIIATEKMYSYIMTTGTILEVSSIRTIQQILEPDVTEKNFSITKQGWGKQKRKYILNLKQDMEKVIVDYLDSGLGVAIDVQATNYIMDYIYATKEHYIYYRTRQLNQIPINKTITDEQLEHIATTFELKKDKEFGLPEGTFKLEKRQRQALDLLRNRVMCLTGPGGSGKTTTAELLIYAAEILFNSQEEAMVFCTPTGKSADRLAEVIKRDTATINRAFGVSGDSLRIVDESQVKKKEGIELILADEMSMPNINLFYDFLTKVDDGTFIYFLGDIEQLPPIGTGKPFANLLSFLPTIVLNVSKRASEGSTITKNAETIIYKSDGVIEPIQEDEDFKIIQEKDPTKAVQAVLDVVSYHISPNPRNTQIKHVSNQTNPVNPDDIQVISPVNVKEWGTEVLNRELQNIFNPRKQREIVIAISKGPNKRIEFRKGDRVLHTKTNEPDREHYNLVSPTQITLATTHGITNGSVGKVKGFIRGDKLDFSAEMSENNRQLLADSFSRDANVMYMAVEYKTYDAKKDKHTKFVILYKSEILTDMGYYMDVRGNDIRNIDLAYALTTHKLQGSEAKIIIMIILPMYGNFISRNMVYTIVSRGRESGYLIGDILGRESMFNRARKIREVDERQSIIDVFEYEEV